MQLKSIQVKITFWAGLCLVTAVAGMIASSVMTSGKALPDVIAAILNQAIVGGVLLIAGLVVLWVVTGRVAAPVRAAAQFAGRIANGENTEKIPVTSDDETGQLVTAMNSMLENSNSLVQSEEKRNELQQSLIRLLDEVSGVAGGDLTREIHVSGDFTGTLADSFNYMIAELRRVIGGVQEVTQKVSSSAVLTQRVTETLAEDSESQVRQITQTSEEIGVMTTSVSQVAETAVLSARVAQKSLESAKQGTEAVQNTIEGMARISQQVAEMSGSIQRLSHTSEEIREIARVITTLANRTGILALNASIQAARAGEAGRGFAVVAKEVTKLSESSSEAARKIADLVRNMQTTTTEATTAMERSSSEVVTGVALANQAGQALSEIETVSTKLAELIQSIMVTARQQAGRSETVARAMTEISEITQRTTTGVRQSAVTVQGLASLADELRASVASFKLPQPNDQNGQERHQKYRQTAA